MVVDIKKERQLRTKFVHVQPHLERRLDVRDAIRQGEGHLLHRRRARFADVIATDADGIPARHLLSSIGEDVGDQAHRRFGRVDVGPARNVLFEQVVLNSAVDFIPAHTLFFGHRQVQREQDCGGRVDRHRRADLVERNAVEQDFHVGQ